MEPVSAAEYCLPFLKILPVVGSYFKLDIQPDKRRSLVPGNCAILTVDIIKAVPVMALEAEAEQYYCY